MKKNINIRFAQISDLITIIDIYNQAIRSKTATGDTVEFVLEDRVDWFSKFDTNSNPI